MIEPRIWPELHRMLDEKIQAKFPNAIISTITTGYIADGGEGYIKFDVRFLDDLDLRTAHFEAQISSFNLLFVE